MLNAADFNTLLHSNAAGFLTTFVPSNAESPAIQRVTLWTDDTAPRTGRPVLFLRADAWDAASHTVRDGVAVPRLPEA